MLEQFWSTLEALPLAAFIGETYWFPMLESLHVIGATFVVGSLLMVDLRLLGFASLGHPVSRITRETLGWSWAAFVLALVTGLGLFITRASHYAANPAFQVKVLVLGLAGLNMLWFHRFAARDIAHWDEHRALPSAARWAGGCSLACWAGVMLAGRWIGHLS